MGGQLTILVADDHPLFRDALKIAIGRVAAGARVLEAGSVTEAIAELRSAARCDLILLDFMMSDSGGFSGLAALHAERPKTPIVVISAAEPSQAALRCVELGAVGFLNKSADLGRIEEIVQRALNGESLSDTLPDVNGPEADDVSQRLSRLTPAQLKVLLGLLEGRLNKQIAYDMSISEATVKAHMTAVFRKLNVRNRTQAVLAARAMGLNSQVEA
jgi:DNA-binding NarL/FixJ family response regulator